MKWSIFVFPCDFENRIKRYYPSDCASLVAVGCTSCDHSNGTGSSPSTGTPFDLGPRSRLSGARAVLLLLELTRRPLDSFGERMKGIFQRDPRFLGHSWVSERLDLGAEHQLREKQFFFPFNTRVAYGNSPSCNIALLARNSTCLH